MFTDACTDEQTDGQTHDGHNAMILANKISCKSVLGMLDQAKGPFAAGEDKDQTTLILPSDFLSAVLTHYQTTIFRLVQIETVCRRQF